MREAGTVGDRARHAGQRLQGRFEPGGHDMGAAAALIPGLGGEGADDGERGARPQREHGAVVLEQHDAPGRRLAGQRLVGVRVEAVRGPAAGHGPVRQGGEAGDGLVENRLGQQSRAHRAGELGVARVAGRGHGQVTAGRDGGRPVGDRAPVADDQAVEAPLAAQHLGQQEMVLRDEHPVEPVVGAHDRPRTGVGHHPLKGAQVDFAQRAGLDVGAGAHPVGLGVVGGEVLQRRADALGLQAAHPGGRQRGGQQRVLGEVLEVAAAER